MAGMSAQPGCLDALRSILMCLYSLTLAEAVSASGLMGLLGLITEDNVNDADNLGLKPCGAGSGMTAARSRRASRQPPLLGALHSFDLARSRP